ncbi:MAG TPA: class I SAM-dependent methyltransferase [Methanomicrobiales archaeon]|nr:class I SAM-dependent methyltransferase [Methanomicrobiales archaeon]
MDLRELARSLGIDYRGFFEEVQRRNAERILQKKKAVFPDPELLAGYQFERHFAHERHSSAADQAIIESSILSRIVFLESCFSREELRDDRFIDLGDSSGIFLHALRQPGTSLNISLEAATQCREKGLEAVRADISSLPFRPGAFDHVIMFQTLEHMPDPIRTLRNLSELSAKSLTLSVPTVSRTTVHRRGYHPGWRDYEHHIFEFSDGDLEKVITHTGLRLDRLDHAVLLDGHEGGPVDRLAMWSLGRMMASPSRNPEYHEVAQDLFWGTFKRFTLLHLRKEPGSGTGSPGG